MTPRMPKISVSTLATRNSSRPYWTAFRHWTRKTAISIELPDKAACASHAALAGSSHAASLRRIGERLHRNAFVAILGADDLAQVDVLHRVVRLRQRERTARAVDVCRLDRCDKLGALAHVTVDRGKACAQHLRRVIALHRVYVGRGLVGLVVVGAKRLVLRHVEPVGVVQR